MGRRWNTRSCGFTLLELMLALGLLAMVAVPVSLSVGSLSQGWRRSADRSQSLQAARVALSRLDLELVAASNVSRARTVGPYGELEFRVNLGGGPTKIRYRFQEDTAGRLLRAEDPGGGFGPEALMAEGLTGLDLGISGDVGLWHLDGGYLDSSPAGNDAVPRNLSPLWLNEPFIQSLQFDGVDGYLEVPDHPSLDIREAMTIEAWVKPTLFGPRPVLARPGAYVLDFIGGDAASFVPQFALTRGGVTYYLASSTPAVLNVWHHYAATWDGATMRIFIDGTNVAQRSLAGPIDPAAGPLQIGGDTTTGSYLAGAIDELHLVNTALIPEDFALAGQPRDGRARLVRMRAVLGEVSVTTGTAPRNIR